MEDDTEKPQITAYEVWKRGRAAGLVDTDTARAAFFTQNFADDYTLQLAPELYVKVDTASCRVKETKKIGQEDFCIVFYRRRRNLKRHSFCK